VQDFTPFTRLKAVLNLWAGVEEVVGNPTLRVPLARMVDSGLKQGMTEWVVAHTLRHHLGIDTHIHGQDGQWRLGAPPLASARPVTILGLGELGRACGAALTALGFPVTGWSRRPQDVPGIRCLAGPDGLAEALTGAQIVILLLPDTPATANILNAGPAGAAGPGRLLSDGHHALVVHRRAPGGAADRRRVTGRADAKAPGQAAINPRPFSSASTPGSRPRKAV
jgi:glyoxylate/hydroxypyruvate reductase A